MRVKYLYISIISVIFSWLISCQSNNENPEIRAEDFYGDGSFFISLARLSSPDVQGDYCSTPTVFELRVKRNLKEFGTSTIYSDKLFLNFQYNLLQDRINEGWGIHQTYVWVGLEEDWINGKEGPEMGWRIAIPGVDVVEYSADPSTCMHQIPLEDWMFENCFVIAARAGVRHPEKEWESADGFVNHGDYLTYSWNELFCLEKCIDPGTYSSEYWISNPTEWPNGLTIGNIFYSIELAIQKINGGNSSEDMTYTLFEQLVAAKLNVAFGNTSYCIFESIEAADSWMEEYGPVGSGISSSSPAWNEGRSLFLELTNYNTGALCADSAQ